MSPKERCIPLANLLLPPDNKFRTSPEHALVHIVSTSPAKNKKVSLSCSNHHKSYHKTSKKLRYLDKWNRVSLLVFHGEQRSKPLWHSIESWLVKMDPYFMAYEKIPYNWVVSHPLYQPTNQGFERKNSPFSAWKVVAQQRLWRKLPRGLRKWGLLSPPHAPWRWLKKVWFGKFPAPSSGNEGFRLGFPNLKMVQNPGGDWNPGEGGQPKVWCLWCKSTRSPKKHVFIGLNRKEKIGEIPAYHNFIQFCDYSRPSERLPWPCW